MRTLSGLLMVLIVSGSECREDDWPISANITGILGDSVRLPCPCSDINMDEEFGWQMESPTLMGVLTYKNGNLENSGNRYRGRTEIFLEANNRNCSLLLKNITTEDKGIYRCRFYIEEIYEWSLVQLNIAANNNCLKETSANVSQCDQSVNSPQTSDSRAYGFLTLIPVMAVFGFGLIFLWHRRRFPRSLPKRREAETDNLYC